MPAQPQAIVLSARTAEQLQQYAESLLAFVRQASGADAPLLRDIAYTLQVGRESMPQRLGFTVATLPELADKLGRFLNGDRTDLHVGRARRADDSPVPDPIARRLDDLLTAWVEGANISWNLLYADERPSRISLPTYPFARERYWIATPEPPRRHDVEERRAVTAAPEADAGVLMLRPAWVEQAISPGNAAVGQRMVLTIGCEVAGATNISPRSAELAQSFQECAVQVFEQIKQAFRKPLPFQIVVGPGDPLCAALAAMLKTARMENPQFAGQLIELDVTAARLQPDEVAGLLRDNAQSPEAHVRYRHGRREVLAWTELDRDAPPAQPVWREGGTYLITGGAGGLGLIFAREIVRHVGNVTLILTGRSQLDAARNAELDALRAQGARVEYRTVDVADAAAVRDLIGSIARDGREAESPLNGIIHSAGVTRDGFLLRKSAADLQAVLAAKVAGTVNLDLATRSLDLDFLVLFSSLAGAVGNPGQCDYATGNAFMDSYAAWRNQLALKGRTLSINWPLWRHGGMGIDDASKETMWQTTGLRPLQTPDGIAAFYRGLSSDLDQVMVLQGDVARLRGLFERKPGPVETEAAPTPEPVRIVQAEGGAGVEQLAGKVETLVAKMLSDMLKLPLHRIETDVPLEQYGVDSVGMMKLTADLEKDLGPLPKTLFFEHPTIAEVGAYLAGAFAPKLTALFRPGIARKPEITPPVTEAQRAPAPQRADPAVRALVATPAAPVASRDIAVIGMSGRFPGAPDLVAFWENLAQGRDCITEVPPERWDHSAYFDPDKSALGKTYCKWGGFLDDVDKFDARFFRIPPSEAELLDPQERLFLETVWNLLESSGYLGETLERRCESRVGVFAGSMSQQYHAFEADWLRASIVALTAPASIANRVSYFFNLQGPSIAIDTMCSSAIVAVHMACESLLKGECRIAIAGGVNLTIHPKKYIALSIGQMIGSSPDSTSFGDGDGYLPSEGVGAVLLKPLQAAIADNDEILAVIKSTATNHGGQSNGYRVPNASAQTELIAGNFAKCGIDPRTVSYVESAANGSRLGDTIEVSALTAGFRKFTADRQFCAIGSVKSNIGHAEAASGMSQLIKVILQMRQRQLVPTIKAEPLNPNIDFAQTPFRLQRQLEEWKQPVLARDGATRTYPRRATVSSFGAGGSNAHLILEEFAQPVPDREAGSAPQLFLLSARTAPQLAELVLRMLNFVEQHPDLRLEDLAYTLQTARETMDHRLALVADGRESLVQALRDWLDDAGRVATLFIGNSDEDNSDIKRLLSGRTGQQMLDLLLAGRELDKLALYWAKGVRIAWLPLHQGRTPRRIALPTYPFERVRHWLPQQPTAGEQTAPVSQPVFAIDARSSVRDNMERYLRDGLSRLLGIPADDIRPGGLFQDYGANSIALTRLRQDFERTFGTPISARDALTHPTPEALATFAATRTAGLPRETSTEEMPAPADGTRQPLSEGQKALWLLHQMAPQMSAYNVPVALRCGAGFDVGLFKQACEQLLRRYPVLGTVFRQQDGELWQTATARLHFAYEAADDEADVVALLRQKSKAPFDLTNGPLFRVHVLSSAAESFALLTIHHIVCDGRSVAVLVRA
nr:short-chain dehydrogenase/reductase SDR [uncultured bacterium]